MIRETLTGASRHVSMMVSGTQGWSFPRRTETGDTSYHYAGQRRRGGCGWSGKVICSVAIVD